MRIALLLPLLSGTALAQAPLDFIFPDGFEQVQAMRIDQLELRDPHLYTQIIVVCQDLTSTLNSQIADTLAADDDDDGYLDNSLTVLFRPIHLNGRSGLAHVGNAQCTAPVAGTSCSRGDATFAPLPYDSLAVGTCLAPEPGTVRPYSPPVAPSVGPCIAAQSNDIELDVGIPLPLSDLRIGASRRENPTPGLHNGLLYGFLSEAAADQIVVDVPLLGPRTLSSLLPGGTGNCAAHSDKDTHDGQPGWWFYFNYSASEVPFTE